ncbi:MAG: TrmH family RNA methyltransferase [Geminicoccaceae bacterium]
MPEFWRNLASRADTELTARFRDARANASFAVLEGFHPLKHALRFGARIVLAATPDPKALQGLAEAMAPDIAAAMLALAAPVPLELFATLAPRSPATGVMALALRPAVDLDTLLASSDGAPLVLLQRPGDLGNLGAVIRVAAAAGAAGVLTTGRHDPWHPAALRGSAGLHFALPVARVGSLPPTPRTVIGVHVVGEALGTRPLPPGAVLAFGSERDGLDADLLSRARYLVTVPMRRGVSSLNLATAAAVVLYASGSLHGPT